MPVVTELERFLDQPVQVLDRTFRITALSWGNPHCVMFVEDTASFPVEKYGPAIEGNTALFPRKTQCHLCPGGLPLLSEDAGVGAGHRRDHRLRHRLLHRGGGRGHAGAVRTQGRGGADRRGAPGGVAHPGRPCADDGAVPYRL